jgi:hypothetical protein
MFNWVGRRLAHYLTKPVKGYQPSTTTVEPLALAAALRPADVLLVDGSSRIATAIKYLTQSTWSHSALYVGPMPGRAGTDGEPHVLIEADVEHGVVSAPLSKYAQSHTRICRPVGLSVTEASAVCQFAADRIGLAYDLRNVFDLLRYFLPTPPVPSRFRRRMIALGAGSPTRAICSTLIAQSFQAISYPILPAIEPGELGMGEAAAAQMGAARRGEILHIRHHSLFAPRDFDISPYFAIIKPTIENGFDFRQVARASEHAPESSSGG